MMRSSSFKVAMSVGFIALVAWSIPACGSDDDGGSGGKAGSAGTAGSGGTSGGGGSAGASGGGNGGAAGGLTCGTTECTAGWKISIIDVPGCCATGDKCGAKTDATIEQILKIPPGCYETEQAGTTDCGCMSYTFTNPIDQTSAQFNGCCRPDGACGFTVNTTSAGGPDLGCVDATVFGAPAATCTPGSETAPPPDPEGGTAYCPVDGGTGGAGGTDGGVGDASTD